MQFDFSGLFNRNQKIKIAGNIPYNITSPLLFRLFEITDWLDRIVLLVQKEIALRLCAQPATKEYGILSVMTKFYCRPKIEFNVSPQVFRPIPRVTSSVVKLVPIENNYSPEFRRQFNELVRKAFNRRRKILRNSLDLPASTDISACPIDLSRRAETLSVAEFIELTNWYYAHFFLDKKWIWDNFWTLFNKRGPLAQRLEHRTHNPSVRGSNPRGPTKPNQTTISNYWRYSSRY